MTALQKQLAPATRSEIRDIVGQCDGDMLAGIVAIGATRDEVLEAFTWLNSDDYQHRKLHHCLSDRALRVFHILEVEYFGGVRPQ